MSLDHHSMQMGRQPGGVSPSITIPRGTNRFSCAMSFTIRASLKNSSLCALVSDTKNRDMKCMQIVNEPDFVTTLLD